MYEKIFSRLLLLLLFVSLSACVAPQQQQIKERYFWPPLPDEPKIEWIGVYNNQNDIAKHSNMLTFLTGDDQQEGLVLPAMVAADGQGKVFVSDIGKFAVMVFDFNAKDTHLLGGGSAATLLEKPSGIDFDEDGNIYVGDINQKKIVVFGKDENPIRVIELAQQLKSVANFRLDTKRKRIIIPDTKGHQIVITDYQGKHINSIKSFKNAGVEDGFRFPNAVDIDPQGNIVVADTVNARIVRFTPEGEFLSIIGTRGDNVGTIDFIKGVAVDSEGHIYIVDYRSDRVQIYNSKGEVLLALGEKGAKDMIGTFRSPTSIYIDKNDTIYITETTERRFQVLQYINKEYLTRNPITEKAPAAKPKADTAPNVKKP